MIFPLMTNKIMAPSNLEFKINQYLGPEVWNQGHWWFSWHDHHQKYHLLPSVHHLAKEEAFIGHELMLTSWPTAIHAPSVSDVRLYLDWCLWLKFSPWRVFVLYLKFSSRFLQATRLPNSIQIWEPVNIKIIGDNLSFPLHLYLSLLFPSSSHLFWIQLGLPYCKKKQGYLFLILILV